MNEPELNCTPVPRLDDVSTVPVLFVQIVPSVLPKLLADPDAAKAQRVMQAMMQMIKLDIAGLEGAARG